MPIDLKRDNVDGKLSRLTYSKGLDIKKDVVEFLAAHPQAFTAEEIVARIDTAANPVMVESVLSHHPEFFEHAKRDGRLYWRMPDSVMDDALAEVLE